MYIYMFYCPACIPCVLPSVPAPPYKIIPQRAQIKLLFALWQAVYEIEPVFKYVTLT